MCVYGSLLSECVRVCPWLSVCCVCAAGLECGSRSRASRSRSRAGIPELLLDATPLSLSLTAVTWLAVAGVVADVAAENVLLTLDRMDGSKPGSGSSWNGFGNVVSPDAGLARDDDGGAGAAPPPPAPVLTLSVSLSPDMDAATMGQERAGLGTAACGAEVGSSALVTATTG